MISPQIILTKRMFMDLFVLLIVIINMSTVFIIKPIF